MKQNSAYRHLQENENPPPKAGDFLYSPLEEWIACETGWKIHPPPPSGTPQEENLHSLVELLSLDRQARLVGLFALRPRTKEYFVRGKFVHILFYFLLFRIFRASHWDKLLDRCASEIPHI